MNPISGSQLISLATKIQNVQQSLTYSINNLTQLQGYITALQNDENLTKLYPQSSQDYLNFLTTLSSAIQGFIDVDNPIPTLNN